MKIGNKTIGEKPYIIAEAGVNHNGSLERALELVRSAAACGCDAIKFQTYTADELVVKGTPKFWDWKGDKDKESQYDAYKAIGGFPLENYKKIMEECEKNNIEFISTPFSFESADYLNSIGMKAFKVASSDMSHLTFLKHIARFGKPIILSTGASTMDEIIESVKAIMDEGNSQIIILHCTLCYPTHIKDLNLACIRTIKEQFPYLEVGLSDHALESETSAFAVAAGAVVLEKHFTLDKSLPDSADHWLSLNPQEMKDDYVYMAHETFPLVGSTYKVIFDCEKHTRELDKRSIVSKKDILAGTVITEDMLTYKRPGTGIWPKEVSKVIGKKALSDIKEDTTLTWTMLN